MDKKIRPNICCLQETHLRSKDTYRIKAKGLKKIFHTIGKEKRTAVVVLISFKLDFKTKTIIRDKERHHIVIKGTIQQEDVTLVNFFVCMYVFIYL